MTWESNNHLRRPITAGYFLLDVSSPDFWSAATRGKQIGRSRQLEWSVGRQNPGLSVWPTNPSFPENTKSMGRWPLAESIG